MSVPAAFADLEPYLEQWALPTETARNAARLSSEMEDITAFYTVMQGRIDDIFAAMKGYSPESLPNRLRPLFYLTLSYCEVAPAVELFKQPSVVDGFDPKRFPRVDIPNMTPPEI